MTLTCSAMLGAGVDNPAVIRYSYTWLDREGIEIVSGSRTIITPTSPSTSSSSTLTLSPLGTTDTNFTCRVTLSDSRNLLRPSDPGEQRTVLSKYTTPVLSSLLSEFIKASLLRFSDCPIGSYLAETSNRAAVCRPCPDNSVSTSSNSRVCVCLQGYYRNLLEAIHVPCTSKSQVISVVAS